MKTTRLKLLTIAALLMMVGCSSADSRGTDHGSEWWEVIYVEGQLDVTGDADGAPGCEVRDDPPHTVEFIFFVSSPKWEGIEVTVDDTALNCNFAAHRTPEGLVHAEGVDCEPDEEGSRFHDLGLKQRRIVLFELDATRMTAKFQVVTRHPAGDERNITVSCGEFDGRITQIQ